MFNEKLQVTRTLGFEVECFVNHEFYDDDDDFRELSIVHSEVGSDGSLYGGDGAECETKTMPISDLNLVEEVYNDLANYDMNVNETCGLHIHVDTSDFTVEDKVRLLRLGAGIELLMFSLVEPYRYEGREIGRNDNEYCTKLHKGWRKIYRSNYISQDIDRNAFSNLQDYIQHLRTTYQSGNSDRIWNGRYQWLNATVSRIPTVEFRIFSATEDYRVAQKFGMLAFHIVETVKNSTVSQIKFIIKSIYQSTSTDEMFTKLFDSIGLDMEFRPEIRNQSVVDYLDTRYCARNRIALTESEAV